METIRTRLSEKPVSLDADALLKGVLIGTLTAAYVLVLFSLVVAVIVLPFGDPREIFVPPAWLVPVVGRFFLLDAFLVIIFGPAFGISLIAALIVLLTTRRVYRWLRVGINDLIYGQHDDAFALMATVHPHLATMTAPQAILPTIAATIAQTLKLPYVAIEAQDAAHDANTPLEGVFGIAPLGAAMVHLPLRYQETNIGELRVAARRSDEALSQSDLSVLGDLARQVGIALYAAQLTADLQRSRTRLVTAREEERRRIRRDLHDGLGPALANFAMRLEQARESLPPGAGEANGVLAQLTLQAQTTIADVRRLVYELRPPTLDEYGLVSALREYLHRMEPKGITATLEAPTELPPLPAAVEVAVFRIVQEAFNNAVKHAQAHAITIALTIQQVGESSHFLGVEIWDDGIGLPADHPVGIGLHSLRERAEELGGTCLIRNGPRGGTQVIAQLPLGV
jgi:signal transduction histidine kinase